jgi:integrase
MTETFKIEITDNLLANVDFRNRIVGVGKDGRPITEPVPDGMTDWFIRDAKMSGFAARITGRARPGATGGIKLYAQRKLAGRPCRFPCGDWPETPLAKARKIAEAALARMKLGEDPNQIKKDNVAKVVEAREKAKLTFGYVLARDAIKREAHDAASTKRDRADVAKWMGELRIWRMPIGSVTHEILGEAIDAIIQQRGAPSAVKCWRYARAAWNRLPSAETPPVDPFAEWIKAGGELPKIESRQTVIDTDDVQGKNWLKSIADLRSLEGSRAYPTRVMADYILLALCWGARRGEAARVKVSEVNFEKEFVVFKDTKNKKSHYFPLTQGCATILKARISDNNIPRGRDVRRATKGESHYIPEWIFPSVKRGKHLVEPRSALETAEKSSGIKIAMHDLRRAFAGEIAADVLGEKKGDFGLVKIAMNHADMQNDVTQGYIMVKARLKMLRSIYEDHERRVFQAAGLAAFLPNKEYKPVIRKDGEEYIVTFGDIELRAPSAKEAKALALEIAT